MLKVFCIFLAILHYQVGASSKYLSLCDSAFCKVLDKYGNQIADLKSLVEQGDSIPQFGTKAQEICNSALEDFNNEVSTEDITDEDNGVYDRKIEDLEKFLDTNLQVIFLKQLALQKENALRQYKQETTKDGSDFEAMVKVLEEFRKEADESLKPGSDWSYAAESVSLKNAIMELSSKNKRITDIKLQSTKQTSNVMQYLQIQQQQLQAIQQQMQGATSPWNVVMAYRIPDTNINLACTYQQGRANVQLSCVSDESAPLLGPNGFVHGVTPGNLGVSFNINI